MATRHVLLILISNIRCSDNTSISSSIVSLNFEVHFQPMIVKLSSGFLTLYDFVLVLYLCILGGFAFFNGRSHFPQSTCVSEGCLK